MKIERIHYFLYFLSIFKILKYFKYKIVIFLHIWNNFHGVLLNFLITWLSNEQIALFFNHSSGCFPSQLPHFVSCPNDLQIRDDTSTSSINFKSHNFICIKIRCSTNNLFSMALCRRPNKTNENGTVNSDETYSFPFC